MSSPGRGLGIALRQRELVATRGHLPGQGTLPGGSQSPRSPLLLRCANCAKALSFPPLSLSYSFLSFFLKPF